jgi:AcrR family transcriptional regulator
MARPLSCSAREKMLHAAHLIVATDGAAACTVDEVARRSGVAKTTIYRHFGGSDGLVLAMVDGLINRTEVPDTGSLQDDLRIICHGYLQASRMHGTRQLFTWMLNRSMDDPEFAEAYRQVKFQSRGPTVIALQRAIARGEVSPELDLELAMHIVQGPFISKRIIENQEVTDADFEALLDMIVNALRG